MANLVYKQTTVTQKKMVGFYDSDKHAIDVDGVNMDILEALNDFNGAAIEVVIKTKEETDLLEES